MRIDVVTLFSDFFTTPLETGLVGRALADGRAAVGYVDPRDFTTDRHRTVDDAPYGGGAGMVMKVEPLAAAIDTARARGGGPVVLLTPQGRRLAQTDLARWAAGDHLVLVAGRYEGFDERVRARVDEEISLGDFVLTGGEHVALAIIDGVVRLLPGTLGNADSTVQDSFRNGLLEHPQYTRPAEYQGASVPKPLLSGHHEDVERWRRTESLARTRRRRPDLLLERRLSAEERLSLAQVSRGGGPRYLAVALSAPTPEGLCEWMALAAAYGLSGVAVIPAPPATLASLEAAISAAPSRSVPLGIRKVKGPGPAVWRLPWGPKGPAPEPVNEGRGRRRVVRVEAVLEPAAWLVPVRSFQELSEAFGEPELEVITSSPGPAEGGAISGTTRGEPVITSSPGPEEGGATRRTAGAEPLIASSPRPAEGWPELAPSEVAARAGAVCLALGPGAAEVASASLGSIRAVCPVNDLPMMPAAAALLERILGER